MRFDDFFYLHFHKFAAAAMLAAGGLAFFLLGGCDGEAPVLAGQITSAGKPVQWGTVSVVGADNKVYSAQIQPDGRYELRGLPPGPVRSLTVNSPNPQARLGGGPPPASKPAAGTGTPAAGGSGTAGKAKKGGQQVAAKDPTEAAPPPDRSPTLPPGVQWFPIPGKYANPATSGLSTEVRPGQTRFDIKAD